MKIGVQFDENGEFVGDFLQGMTLPDGHTLIQNEELPEPLYFGPTKRPKLVDGVIDQSEAQAEIEALAAVPQPETAEEKIDRLESDNLSLMMALTDVYEQLLTLQTQVETGE